MSVFRFKKFSVTNEKSAMKVNTDGVLLGAALTVKSSDRHVLDVGTGTGTIALMVAQRLSALNAETCHDVMIEAIDIDEASAEEAALNFHVSPWDSVLSARHISLDDYMHSDNCEGRFDLIFSNPPYFDDFLQAPAVRRNNARHTSSGLSYRELLEFSSSALSTNGRFSIVLPAETEHHLLRHARMCGLFPFRTVRIRTVPRKAPGRIIVEFSRIRTDDPEDVMLTIQNEGKYTEEYLSLTKDFYLFA